MTSNGNFHHEPKVPLKKIRRMEVDGAPLFCDEPSRRKLQRWVKWGYRGVKLEAKREGNVIYTSVGAVRRFMEAIQ